MDRYKKLFQQDRSQGSTALILSVMLGDPTPQVAIDIVDEAIHSGCDGLELIIPFSDPVFEDAELVKAHQRAVVREAQTESYVEQLRLIRARHHDVPITVSVYTNVVDYYGAANFYRDMSAIGIDGVYLADCPIRQATHYRQLARRYDIAPIFLATPDIEPRSLAQVCRLRRGYIRYVPDIFCAQDPLFVQTSSIISQQTSVPLVLDVTHGHDRDAVAMCQGVIDRGAVAAIVDESCGGARLRICHQVAQMVRQRKAVLMANANR